MAVAGGGWTPKKAGLRSRALSGNGCGATSSRTPTSYGPAASPKTPTSGGGASPKTPTSSVKTPTSAAASLLRRHTGTPKKLKSGSPLVRGISSCPRGWAPVCVVQGRGKGAPLRRGRTGADTPAAYKKLVSMPSYKMRTPAESIKTIPRPRYQPLSDSFHANHIDRSIYCIPKFCRIPRGHIQCFQAPNKVKYEAVTLYQKPMDFDSDDDDEAQLFNSQGIYCVAINSREL